MHKLETHVGNIKEFKMEDNWNDAQRFVDWAQLNQIKTIKLT